MGFLVLGMAELRRRIVALFTNIFSLDQKVGVPHSLTPKVKILNKLLFAYDTWFSGDFYLFLFGNDNVFAPSLRAWGFSVILLFFF